MYSKMVKFEIFRKVFAKLPSDYKLKTILMFVL